MKKILMITVASLMLSGCATLVNDSHVPIAMSFSDGSSGECALKNKRFAVTVDLPTTVQVRRSDDGLQYDCKTADGRTALGLIPSTIEGAKLAASVVFFDFGITDAITDMHRDYPASFVIPVQ